MTAETKLANVILHLDETMDCIIKYPRMCGNAQGIELEFLTLLSLKEVALGRESEIAVHKRWIVYIDICFPNGPKICYLSGRKEWPEDLVEFASHLRLFREQLGL